MDKPILNLSAYLFVTLHDLPALRAQLLASAQAAALKGTVLLAEEGINLVMAGQPAALRGWLNLLRRDERLAALTAKESYSAEPPFQRLKVKIKAEIIRMNRPQIRPQAARAPSVNAATLARWLAQGRCDAGRLLALLDTRNAFEVDAGAFEGAIDWRLQRFSDFPQALQAHRAELEGKTVVSYCTGGIRCEKAALLMQEQGLPHALQLEGGILRYFEDTSDAPAWHGHCFVFDERVELDTALTPAAA